LQGALRLIARSPRVVVVCALALTVALPAEPMVARDFGSALGVGAGVAAGIIGGAIVGGAIRGQRGGGGARSKHESDSSNDNNNNNNSSRDSARSMVMVRNSADVVFKGIRVSKGLGAVGVEEAIDPSKQDFSRDNDRDYNNGVRKFVSTIDRAAKDQTKQGDSTLSQGDVTQHAIDRSVTQAYETANLATFEQFVGEQWTNERMRVAILDRASAEIPSLVHGNNFGKVEMASIDEIIQRAGRSIYRRTLETSELIALNQATARFTRALFELRGPGVNNDLRSGVEGTLLTASKAAFADYAERFVRSEFGVVMRYRAERILDDCLTANLDEITSVGKQAATREQMNKNVEELSRGECRNWVVNAIGDTKQLDPKDDLKLLKPVPERAVWIAPGVPKTDASMFGRVTNNL
jgi:hypothetical protein